MPSRLSILDPHSLPHPGPAHHLLELGPPHAAADAGAAVGLEDHVLEELVVDVLLEGHGDALQVSQGQGRGGGVAIFIGVVVPDEEAEGFIDLGRVGLVRIVVARVQLQGADGDEGLVGGVALVVGVEDGEEFAEFGFGGGEVEGAVWGWRLVLRSAYTWEGSSGVG